MPSEAEWLGLCIRSESDQPHEWWPIGWSIRNRVLSRRYPDLFQAVILSKKQFSYFNQWIGRSTQEIWEEARKGYAGDNAGWPENDLDQAILCATDLIHSPRWRSPFGADVMHYWSPVSMVPKGASPPWARQAKRIFTPSGVDPERFRFAAGVP